MDFELLFRDEENNEQPEYIISIDEDTKLVIDDDSDDEGEKLSVYLVTRSGDGDVSATFGSGYPVSEWESEFTADHAEIIKLIRDEFGHEIPTEEDVARLQA